MEAQDMKPIFMLSTLVLALVMTLGAAQASEVFVTKDAQGHPVYTDRPEQLPAERLNVKSNSTDTVEVQKRYESEMKRLASTNAATDDASKKQAESTQAAKTLDADRAKRCQDARDRYLKLMNSQRLYEQDPNDTERHYLTDAQMDAAREDGKRVMDEFCGEP